MPLLLIIALLSLTAYAKPAKAIPSTATKYIFETLVRSTGDQTPPKAPRTIEAKNVDCRVGSGSPMKYQCKATFNIDGKDVEKSIDGDHNKFYEYLNAKSAIPVSEVRIGGVYYKANKISCTYSLDGGNYYSCTSDVTVKF